MAFVTDPDDLSQISEVTIDTGLRTITLNASGDLGDPGTQAADNGVTLQCLYSFLKEEWRSDPLLIPFPFPLVAITPEQFEWVDDWEPANDATRQLIRNAGWSEVATGGAVKRTYIGVVSLGNIDAGDTPYYFFNDITPTATDFDFDGPINQAVQTFGDSSNGNFDNRTDSLFTNIRIFGKTYGQSSTIAIGIPNGTTLPTNAQRFPLSEATDLKITNTLADVFTAPIAPYDDIEITYESSAATLGGFVPIGGDTPGPGDAQFGVTINADAGGFGGGPPTAEQIYEYVQAALQATTNINAIAPSRIGQFQDPLLRFVGDNLEAIAQTVANAPVGGTGVAIENFDTNDTNRLQFVDNDGDNRTFPFVAAGSINFSQTLQDEPVGQASYWMFFTNDDAGDNTGQDYGTPLAIIVDDNSGTDIQGDVDGNASVAFDFDYDGNTQRGVISAGTDAPITIVAIGTAVAQFVVATGTITRNVGQSFSVVAALERNYSNP